MLVVGERFLNVMTVHNRKGNMIDDSGQRRLTTMICLPCQLPVLPRRHEYLVPLFQSFAEGINLASIGAPGGCVAAFQQNIRAGDKRNATLAEFLIGGSCRGMPLIRPVPQSEQSYGIQKDRRHGW